MENVKPQWLQRLGESCQRAGDRGSAIQAYNKASAAFAGGGEPLKAIALCKVALALDPAHNGTQTMLSRLIARPEAFRQKEAPSPWIGQGTPENVFGSNTQMEGMVSLSPDSMATSGDLMFQFGADDKTGPPRSMPPGFEGGMHTPTHEAVYSFEEGAEATGPARYPVAPPPPEPPIEIPRSRPTAPARTAPAQTGSRRGDVSAPAIQALAPLVQLEQIKLRDVIVDAREMEMEDHPQQSSGVFHIPLPDPQPASPPPERDRGSHVDSLLRKMPRVPLLSSLPPDALRSFIEKVELRAFYAGESIISQGDKGNSMFILVQGEVQISHSEGGSSKRLGSLKEGSFFGEVALITASERMFTVEARTDVMALVVSRKLASALVREHPQVLQVLLRFMRDRLASAIAETHELFAPFTRDERRQLIRRFKFIEAKRGAQLLLQGSSSRGMYILLAGTAEVVRNDEVVRQLRSGDIFGKTSIVANKPSLNSVRTTSKCWMLRLDENILRDTIMTHPKVLAALGKIGMTAPYKAFKGGAEPAERLKLI